MNGLNEDIVISHLWQLLLCKLKVFLTGTYEYILLWQEFDKTVVGSLQLRTSRTEEIHKLFGIQIPTTWPQTSAAASCEDDTEISLICFFHL